MKVLWTDEALRDLDEIVGYILIHYPKAAPAFDARIRAVISRLGRWPNSARRSTYRDEVRVIPLGRYPYKIFYRVMPDAVEILHLHHSARQPWDERS